MAEDDEAEVLKALLTLHSGRLGNARFDPDGYRKIDEAAVKTMKDLFSALQPWTKVDEGETVRQLTDTYKKVFGADPSDPAFVRRLAETLQKRREEAAAARPAASQDDVINRRMRERDEKVRARPRR